ncbi:MAG: cation diffusion facilitator family transporter [Bacilli bacterium]|nr:cation diffusion facilitator family transporter [Bacilli bacterium]
MNKVTRVMLVSLTVNTILSTVKIIAGFFAKSQALIADGIHSFSDLTTDLVAIIGNKIALKKPDEKHPYGHGKLEYLTSIIIGAVIVALGVGLILESFNEKTNSIGLVVLLVSLFTIIFKFLLAHYIVNKGHEYHNNILIASGKESSADVVSSIFVLISSIFMIFKKYNPAFGYADIVATIIVGLFIIRTGILILKENISIILGEQETDNSYMSKLRKVIMNNQAVEHIDKLVLLKFGQYYQLNCEVSMNENLTLIKAHSELEQIEKDLSKYDEKIRYKTIHINPYKRRIK